MKDLEIRGAGNLLGGEQSGHIADVGFDLYVRLVGEAVNEFKGDGEPELDEVRIELPGRRAPAARLHPERAAPARDVQAPRRGARRRGRRRCSARRWSTGTAPRRSRSSRCSWSRGSAAAPAGPGIGEVTIAGRNVRFAPVELPESRVVRLNRLYPKSIVKAPVKTILVPRPGIPGRTGTPLAGIALLQWAHEVIDAVLDPPWPACLNGPVLKRVVAGCRSRAAAPDRLRGGRDRVQPRCRRPGGRRVVTTDQVDDLTAATAAPSRTRSRPAARSFRSAPSRPGSLAQLAFKSAAEQIARRLRRDAERRLQAAAHPDPEAGARTSLPRTATAFIEVQSTQPYYIDLLTQVGAIELADEGREGPDHRLPAGARARTSSPPGSKREGLEFDPRYGISIVDGAPDAGRHRRQLRVRRHRQGRQGRAVAQEPDAAYVAALPASAICG